MAKPDIGYYIAELRHMACNAGMDVDDKAHLEAAADELDRLCAIEDLLNESMRNGYIKPSYKNILNAKLAAIGAASDRG